MKNIIALIITMVLTALTFNSFATSPVIESGPTLRIVQYDLSDADKGLDVEIGSFVQSISEIQVLSDKIKIIPEVSPKGTEVYQSGIPYATICISKKLSPAEFKNLRYVEASGVSYIPSVKFGSPYNGTTTIGSDTVSLIADAPVIGRADNSGLRFSSSIDLTSVDPVQESSRYIVSSLDQRPNYSEFGKSSQSLTIAPFHYFYISLNIKAQEDKDHFSELLPNQVGNEIISGSYFMNSYDLGNYWGYDKTTTEGPMRIFIYGSSVSDDSVGPGEYSSTYNYFTNKYPEGNKITDPKVEFCWKTNNYESVTTEGAELIDPRITLGFIQ